MDKLRVNVNGRIEAVPLGATIVDTLRALFIDPSRSGIAVAVNDEVVRRSDWQGFVLSDGDRVDVIQATQGG